MPESPGSRRAAKPFSIALALPLQIGLAAHLLVHLLVHVGATATGDVFLCLKLASYCRLVF